jgi:small subunit ribosomal protein S8e
LLTRAARRCCCRPGQCGRADGYILEGKELEFYVRKMQKKKKA